MGIPLPRAITLFVIKRTKRYCRIDHPRNSTFFDGGPGRSFIVRFEAGLDRLLLFDDNAMSYLSPFM